MKNIESRIEKLEQESGKAGELVVIRDTYGEGESLYWQNSPTDSRLVKQLKGVSIKDLL